MEIVSLPWIFLRNRIPRHVCFEILFQMFRIQDVEQSLAKSCHFQVVPHVSDPRDMEQKLRNFFQDSVPHVSDLRDMEQKLELLSRPVPHVLDPRAMEQSSGTMVFHMFS